MEDPIAIVGSACRFPGEAASPSKLWDLLKAPRDVLRDFPEERLNLSSFYSPHGDHHGRTDVQNRAYLLEEDCRLFDAAFFRTNPKEARAMDPQQRMLLETVYEAIEAAGWLLEDIENSPTSVLVGVMTADYNDIQMRDPETLPTYTATGLARSILSNRISYFFNLRGPSVTIDTACSSSLVALHQAIQGIRNGDATQAIVAGTTLLLDPAMYIAESNLHMLSPDSRSRMWDMDANGYARGEGCAAILIKPLSKAIQDNDHIECLVRKTGVNSDGCTSGITMPSSSAQADLIRQTYANAQLDPIVDPCQFFECHGTGTLAGDPTEAQAIQETFFPQSCNENQKEGFIPLYCGSIKTVVGHLEGCAGLAGVLKASLAVQNRMIPPNMHFDQLNPAIEPFYKSLCVPTSLLPWPDTHGNPLRASVNSFGFGGTNAHAIIESYDPISQSSSTDNNTEALEPFSKQPGPFVFSAKSRSSLLHILKETMEYIQVNPSLDLDSFSWLLQKRRSTFPMRIAITGSDRQPLLDALGKQIDHAESSSDVQPGVRALAGRQDPSPIILGVFTGQGAQWAKMGTQLIKHCRGFRDSLEKCDNALKALPEAPSWSLMDELAVEDERSRISQAEFSQPLCAAVQIALVDVLAASGVKFGAVIGHSSGEIGAAYAAGVLNARDAIGIAYYRGHVASMAKGAAGKQGGMLAVGISYDAATAFCSQPRYDGRIWVAASNAPSTVTLSGDLDAIREAKASFDEDGVFARQLKIDTAYHSPHMSGCATAYLMYLKQLKIQIQTPREECNWFSSVQRHTNLLEGPFHQLKDQYWADNMVHPVLYSQALESSVSFNGSVAAAVEVGPHPALKSATNQTMKNSLNASIVYTGCMERRSDDMESLSAAIGLLWSHFGPALVDFHGWRKLFRRSEQPCMLKNLPSYAWDHDQVYWHESRSVRNYRLRAHRPHELLGRLREEGRYLMEWRNVLHLNEVPWLRGHTFQGQVIFPGAGYVSMATQAAVMFAGSHSIKLVEILDLQIHRALVIDENDEGVETLLTLRSCNASDAIGDDSILEADFICCSSPYGHDLDKTCDGRVLIHLGQSASGDFPHSSFSSAELPSLNVDKFFNAVAELGINYDGVFHAIDSIERILGHSRAFASWAEGDLGDNYALHPAILDVVFQTAFSTFASLAENALGCVYLPAGVKRVVVSPTQLYRDNIRGTSVAIEAHLVDTKHSVLEIDCSLRERSTNAFGIQVDGLVLKAVAEPLPSDDRLLFAKTVWDNDASCSISAPPLPKEATKADLAYVDAVDRTALFYLQNLALEIQPEEVATVKPHHKALLDGISAILKPVHEGHHQYLKKEWLKDDFNIIHSFASSYPDSVDLALLAAVGENLPSVLRGESEMLEHMLKDDLLSRLYAEGRGFAACNDYVAFIIQQISHRYPRMKILEVGAGTGGTTRKVLDAIGNKYSSYTYTDISAGFFEKAAERFVDRASTMDFKTLNVELPPADQGFAETSYDIIIAANVLHATRTLSKTIRNVRRLLRPGGFLIAVETTGNMLRETGLMGGLEGWWMGMEEGRFPGLGISAKQWHDVLQTCGFSGVETIIYDLPDVSRHNCSVFYTQAMNEDMRLLKDPLASTELLPDFQVLIVGGQTLSVSKAVRQAEKMLRRCTPLVATCANIEELSTLEIEPETAILCLTELDKPIFSETLSAHKLENLQEMIGYAQSLLWVTCEGMADNPHSNMMIGIARALSFELPHVQMQVLNFDQSSSWNMEMAVQYLLRMVVLSLPQYREHSMLWVQEPEIEVSCSGTPLIPRVVPDHEANEYLNANRRRITKSVNECETVEVVHSIPHLRLVKSNHHALPGQSVEIDVLLSTALHMPHQKPRFLCMGHLRGTSRTAFAIINNDTSTAKVPKKDIFEPPPASTCNVYTFFAVTASLIASHLIYTAPADGTILVHEPSNNLALAIAEFARLSGRKVLFISTSFPPEEIPETWVCIHSLTQTYALRRLIPADTKMLIRFSNAEAENILPVLPKECPVRSFDPWSLSEPKIAIASAYALGASLRIETSVPMINIDNVHGSQPSKRPLDIVLNWKRAGPLSATIAPFDVNEGFAADKTYFLVGMAGELGQSLCRFMVECGARHIVLASRHPTHDTNWLFDLRATGADVRVIKTDVTDRRQVQETVATIRSTMPKIAGVANAALVLEDSLFVFATAANVEHQLKPKVDGTIHLDEEFANDDLDFFIAFSSLGTVYGNAGQSIYHAAKMFMTSLVEKRRRRGQAASVINIGMIVDVGYVAKNEREGIKIEEHLRTQFYTPLAETDFHHLILQAVLLGRADSPHGDVTMGIRHFIDSPNAPSKPPWYDNPRLSHMIFQPVSSDSKAHSGNSIRQLREKFDKAGSVAEATDALKELFCEKLESMVRIPASSIDVESPLSNLGLDSLLAVEIRTWLHKKIHFEIPLLKIMGQDSLYSICASAAQAHIEAQDLSSKSRPIDIPDITAKPEITSSTLDLGQEVDAREKDVTYPGAEDIKTTESTLVSLPSGTTSSLGDAPFSPSLSSETPADTTTSSLSLATNLSVALADLEGSKTVTQYKNTERLSYAQASMLFLHNFLDDPTAFNVTAQYHISGPLNTSRFSKALERTLTHHDAYQTCFFTDHANLEQRQGITSNYSQERFTHMHSVGTDYAYDVFQTLAKRVWKLASGQTFHAVMLTHTPNSHTIIFACHHIIMDGMSWHIFLQDLSRAYQMLPLNAIGKSYLDFAQQEINALSSDRLESSIRYWTEKLSPIPGVLPLLPLAKTKCRTARRSYGNHVIERQLSSSSVQRVRDASTTCKATPMQFYLATVQALFARLSSIEDICIGVTDAGRNNGEFSNTIGHFTNILPMRFFPDKAKSFVDLVHNTSRTVLSGFGHSKIPIDVILKKLELLRSSTHTPLYQVAFNHRVGDLLHRELCNCTMNLMKYEDTKKPYDFTFNITQMSEGRHFVEVCSSDYLYSVSATETVMNTFLNILENVATDPSIKVRDCKLCNIEQAEGVLSLGRGPRVQHSWPETLTERFEQVCSNYPEAISIKYDKDSINYAQLANRVNLLAESLIEAGAQKGHRIAVMCQPSVDTYAAMLAVLHINAVYVPLDMNQPAARHQAMIRASNPALLLFHAATASEAANRVDLTSLPTVNLSNLSTSSAKVHGSFSATPGQESFLLFSSGSTGTPKGIRLSQRGIMNYAASKSAKLGLGQVKVLQQSSTGFDMSIAQAFNAFANAGTLVVVPSKARGDPSMLAQMMLDEAIELAICTPSEYSLLVTYAADTLRRCTSWQHACSGGEAVGAALVSGLRRLELPELALTDCYGPTEISCAVTLQSIPLQAGTEGAVTLDLVGKPIPNTSVYIVGEDYELLPVGLPGEICVAGLGVANGYLDAELTSSKFVQNPFPTSQEVVHGGGLVYRTGDKGYLCDDGSLVFLGRIDGDSLVKLRGLRIELDEVANAILIAAKGSLADAVVTIRGEPEFLVAHVVFAHNTHWDQTKLDELCADLPLPRYMIPSLVMELEHLPVTANGKVDMKTITNLPLPASREESQELDSLTVPEGEMRIIWKDILGEAAGAASIRRDTDFFTVGGSSLLLVRLQNALKERMGVDLALHELYQASTLRKMAAISSSERSQLVTETINWAAETKIPSDWSSVVQAQAPSPPRHQRRQVLLTGSTGFLGSEIYKALIDDKNVAQIYCIAVPADTQHKVPGNNKTTVYTGSLFSPRLGLSEKEVSMLQSKISQIIHAGVLGHCLNNYSSVRQANYVSTQFLASIALYRNVPLHFISSARVILQSGAVEAGPVSMASHPPPADGSQGFAASKWASEVFLETVARSTNLPIMVHRPCSIIGSCAPNDDAMNSVVKFSLLSQSVPDVPQAEGFFDFKDVGEVAEEIACGGIAQESISFRHHSSGVRVPFSQLKQRMQTLYGHSFETVSLADWIQRARKLGIEDLIISYLEANVAGAERLVFPFLGK